MTSILRGCYEFVENRTTVWPQLNTFCKEMSSCYNFRDHRKVLFGVNLIVCLASLSMSLFSAYLCYLFYHVEYYTVWIGWLGLSALTALLAVICIVGMRGAHLVSLDMLLTYFWGVTVFTSPLLLGVVVCMDFYSYVKTLGFCCMLYA